LSLYFYFLSISCSLTPSRFLSLSLSLTHSLPLSHLLYANYWIILELP
jgi:hypothetical protein